MEGFSKHAHTSKFTFSPCSLRSNFLFCKLLSCYKYEHVIIAIYEHISCFFFHFVRAHTFALPLNFIPFDIQLILFQFISNFDYSSNSLAADFIPFVFFSLFLCNFYLLSCLSELPLSRPLPYKSLPYSGSVII